MEIEQEPSPEKKTRAAPDHQPNPLLRQERERRGWSQARLAKEIEAPSSNLITRWENGDAFPSPHYREKLCKVFEKDAEELGLIKRGPEKSKRDPAAPTEPLDETKVQELFLEPSKQTALWQRVLSRRKTLIGLAGGLVGAGTLAWWLSTRFSSPSTATMLYIYRPDHPMLVNSVSWSPLGTFIACAMGDKTVKVLEASAGSIRFVYQGHKDNVNGATWSPDGTYIASASTDKTVQIWKAQTGELVLTYEGHSKPVYNAVWSHNGKYIASSGADTTVHVWKASSGELLAKYLGHKSGVWNITWSPDDTSIATSEVDGDLQVWHSLTAVKSPTFTYQGSFGPATDIDWSPHGNQIVSTHSDSSVRIWDVSTGSNVLTYKGHTGIAWTARWSRSGQYIASGGDDKKVQIWEASTGRLRAIDQNHMDSVREISWASDNQRFASASNQLDDEAVYVCKAEL